MAISCADQKIAQTASNEVFFPRQEEYSNWKNEINTYVTQKTEF